ncbi:MAB_1171c family putative transporter [Streptomyces sp. ADMS]|uniref:MAB_1171c family putative transporter n=1 Tax=Streptomyces sp. ADMS TaxID=3071415 RepID=UPI00296F4961|nr:MAB_1171c family putative transporter [Streptomyces sp. ADMS]MDW4910171.1 MAB_1171c family putative transporter [Streptomyces sp. ADMS]
MNPSGFPGEPYPVLVFGTPIAVLAAALVFKLPSIVRLWRDPLRRAAGGLLLLACGIFVFAAPPSIAWTNRVTGVPNIAAPLVYSLLIAFCGASLLLMIAWRGGHTGHSARSARARRAMRWVAVGHAGVIVALWALFGLAEAPVERRRDLDTYYARTPFMRELIVVYLLAHTTSCVLTYRLIRNWIHTAGLDVWLRRGLQSLAVGYAANLVFDAAKGTAVVARWAGRDLDPLSTELAPAAAGVAAVLIATGFVLPHAGQYLRDRWRIRRDHSRLGPLYDLLRTATGRGVPFSVRATPELRLTRRETFIRDALLQLARHFDEELRRRAYGAAEELGYGPRRAEALAAAVTIRDAIAARAQCRLPSPQVTDHGTDLLTDLLQSIEAVSEVLSHPDEIEAVRTLATAPAESLHVHE